ncbi:hypothetical protein [Streptomyces rubiginosohelvolus]
MHIADIREIPDSAGLVTFTGPAGRAWGRWHGDVPPVSSCFVEIDIPDSITNWESTQKPDILTGEPEEELTVCAVIDSVDEDGMVALRMNSDIILVEWEATQQAAPGDRIRFSTPTVDIYPYTL